MGGATLTGYVGKVFLKLNRVVNYYMNMSAIRFMDINSMHRDVNGAIQRKSSYRYRHDFWPMTSGF